MRAFFLGIILISIVSSYCDQQNKTSVNKRTGKLFSVFQMVTFQNTGCASSSAGRNGTCFTAGECSDKDGTSSGSCADGFGVCCVFSLGCGETSSQNCTFLVQNTVTSVPNGRCDYKICKSSSDICRLKFDFTTFDIVGPFAATTDGVAGVATVLEAVGDCLTDRFSVTSPGNVGTPIICGFNTGQQVYVDASDACNTINFDISAGDSTSRSWDIKVTQYNCGDDNGGEDGCLQYHTGRSGTIASFNFPTNTAMVAATTNHLSNQIYNICIRRESGFCAICYGPSVMPAINVVMDQASFGVSLGAAAAGAAQANQDSDCSTDYLMIPAGMKVTTGIALVIGTTVTNMAGVVAELFCGRVLSATDAEAYIAITGTSICSQSVPFNVGVHFDSGEVNTEDAFPTGGIVGFSLNYNQIAC